MTNLITNNAYRILGLDGSANQKDILKRAKEIGVRLKIDDYPKYDLDINLPDNIRTEESVNDALKRLQNVKYNLNEYFFWFNISDTVDENAFENLRYSDAASFDTAIQIWQNASITNNSTGLLYKKNLALLYCLILFNEENDDYLNESLSLWKEIIDSDKFWTAFEKSFAINNDQVTNSDMMYALKENIVKHTSNIYHDLHLQYENKKYIRDFHATFDTIGEKTEENILNPIHESIYDTIRNMRKIRLKQESDVSETNKTCDNCGNPVLPKMYKRFEDTSILCKTCDMEKGKERKKRIKEQATVQGSSKTILQINRTITKLKSQLDQLHEIGLYDNVQSKVVRDDASQEIRHVAIMIHNDMHMKSKSLELLNLAKTIAGTQNVKEKWEIDIQKINEIMDDDEENTWQVSRGILFKKELTIKNDSIQYHNTKIFFNDVLSLAIPGGGDKKFFISIKSNKDKMKIPFDHNTDQLLGVLQRIGPTLDPIIVDKLVRSIFEDNQTVTIGKVDFDKNGYHTSKIFKRKSVLWNDDIYPAENIQGTNFLFEKKDDMRREFATVHLKEPNAYVIPELVKACWNEYHMRNPQ